MTRRAPLTVRQIVVLDELRISLVMRSGTNGAILRALERRGYVISHSFSEGQNTYYTWTLTEQGKRVASDLVRAREVKE